MRLLLLSASVFSVLALCSNDSSAQAGPTPQATAQFVSESPDEMQGYNPERNSYFGDLHVHTMYSFDAFMFGTRQTPDDAYQYAKGETIYHSAGFAMSVDTPLDFYAVTDHGRYMGAVKAAYDPTTEIFEKVWKSGAVSVEQDGSLVIPSFYTGGTGQITAQLEGDRTIMREAWDDIVAAAERHNDPGKFTTFAGYEFTVSSPGDGGNLHRNVIFRDSNVPDIPFTSVESRNPEDLWAWMDNLRATGVESLAIPHNSNGSNGHMFALTDFSGRRALDGAYAEQRMRNEPLVEITQIKGTSDTHPVLSPNDEWADFEIMEHRIASNNFSEPSGSYVREAYLNGLKLENEQGINPFKFGLIGSSDTHNASGSGPESNYWGKLGVDDAYGTQRGSLPLRFSEKTEEQKYRDDSENRFVGQYWSASGLAGVWAEENTRNAIYDAFRRKETFGTSGTRMKVRFFAGYDLFAPSSDDAISRAYENGVPMGGDLLAEANRHPEFLVWVAKDPNAAPLDRVQVIKGWVENGEVREQVFDVACSSGTPDSRTFRCADNGAQVDLQDCSISTDIGASELRTLWRDPEYDPNQRAFYYVRGLENPTCRWSTWDALHAGVQPREGLPLTIQERIWSSPIWITPNQ